MLVDADYGRPLLLGPPLLYLPAKNPTDKAAKPKPRYFNVSMIICDVLMTHF